MRPPCLTDKDDFICVGNTRTEGLTETPVEFWKPPGSVHHEALPSCLPSGGGALLKALGLESRIPCSRPVSGCATVPSYSFTEFSTYGKRARVCGIARLRAGRLARCPRRARCLGGCTAFPVWLQHKIPVMRCFLEKVPPTRNARDVGSSLTIRVLGVAGGGGSTTSSFDAPLAELSCPRRLPSLGDSVAQAIEVRSGAIRA